MAPAEPGGSAARAAPNNPVESRAAGTGGKKSGGGVVMINNEKAMQELQDILKVYVDRKPGGGIFSHVGIPVP